MKDLQHFARRRNIPNGEDDLEEREQGQQYEPVAPAQQINESSLMEKEHEMDGSAGEPNTEEERKAYEKEKLDNLTEEDVREAIVLLKKYKEGKATLDRKIRANEEWWKLRHWGVVESE